MRYEWQLLALLAWPMTVWCASPVPIMVYAEVDHALRPTVVLSDPEAYRGRILLLGGVVTQVIDEHNLPAVVITGYQLDENDRPLSPDPELGQLLIVGSTYDGISPQPGRLITVVGKTSGQYKSSEQALPRIDSIFVHLWPTAEEEAVRDWMNGCAWRYCDSWYDPWSLDPWRYGPDPSWCWGGYYLYRH